MQLVRREKNLLLHSNLIVQRFSVVGLRSKSYIRCPISFFLWCFVSKQSTVLKDTCGVEVEVFVERIINFQMFMVHEVEHKVVPV